MNRMHTLRAKKGISMKEAARLLNMPYTTYVNYEKGSREPNSEVLIQIARFYDTTIDYLVGRTDFFGQVPENMIPLPKTYRVPLLGSIACGSPALAAENIDGEVEVPDSIRADFALLCKGDSMINARIFNGDIVYIRQQDMVQNGEIAAVLIDEEATLKRVRLFEDHISLEPENPMFKPIVFWGEDMNTVRILGKAVAFTGGVQ